MSTSIDKTKLGAGDGLRTPTLNSKLKSGRAAVPSSRRFTPRAPSLDSDRSSEVIQQRLQEAIDSVNNAATQSQHEGEGIEQHRVTRAARAPARCKRAQTVAEITPSKKASACHGLFGSGNAKDQLGLAMTKKASARISADGKKTCTALKDSVTDDEQRERNVEAAGRRVYSQLLLNAWRHKRRDAAALADSSALLHQQVQQLQMQVDVLQQLRQSEGRRRSEAAQDNCKLRADLQQSQEKCQQLLKENDDLLRKQKQLDGVLTDLKMELATEQESVSKATQDLMNEEKSVEDGLKVINILQNEREKLENKVKSLEDTLDREHKKIKNLSCDIVNLENTVHGEMLRNKKYLADLDTLQTQVRSERDRSAKLVVEMTAMEHHQAKNSHKLSDLKKRLTVVNEIKRQVIEDNCILKSTVAEMQILLQKEREKPWWRTSGQLMFAFVHNAAYLLLPNLPKNIFNQKKMIGGNSQNETNNKDHKGSASLP